VIAFGLLGLALVAAGPQFVVRKLLRRVGLWLALLVAAGVTLSAYMESGIPTYLERPAAGGWPSFWQAVDVMLIVPLLWLPVVADYGRLGKDVGGTFRGSFIGLFVATAWLGFLGVVYLPAVETGDIAGFVVGTQLGLGALIILLLLQTDEVFANAHSAGMALEAVPSTWRWPLVAGAAVVIIALPFHFLRGALEAVPSARRWPLVTGAAAVILALATDFTRFEVSLLMLASLFVPLFGVLTADYIFSRGAAQRAIAPAALIAWALGFLLYHWISPADVGWWQDAMRWLFADTLQLSFPLTDEVTWLGAAIPSFLLGFVLHGLTRALLGRWRPQPAAARAS
jgi:NCS1 family nucleobase:cation symporter-1